ncbi:MAG: protein TolR [Desulfobacterales bacterium]|nr:protein TolR [Desulfobacterales bacterium]
MGPTNTDNGLMSEINVTPFVDVMLVLLVIFMVTAPLMVHGVNVNLPQTTATPLPTDKENLVLTINSEGRIYINEVEIQMDFLQQKVQKIMENRSDQEIYLRADQSVPYGMVIKVMAQIKAAGIEKLGLVTDPYQSKDQDKKKVPKG